MKEFQRREKSISSVWQDDLGYQPATKGKLLLWFVYVKEKSCADIIYLWKSLGSNDIIEALGTSKDKLNIY